jgi:hypothetical protein
MVDITSKCFVHKEQSIYVITPWGTENIYLWVALFMFNHGLKIITSPYVDVVHMPVDVPSKMKCCFITEAYFWKECLIFCRVARYVPAQFQTCHLVI